MVFTHRDWTVPSNILLGTMYDVVVFSVCVLFRCFLILECRQYHHISCFLLIALALYLNTNTMHNKIKNYPTIG